MIYKILFPCSPYDIKNVDETFEKEYNVSKLLSFDNYFFDHDSFVDGTFIHNINFDDECILILRSWMLKPEQYKDLISTVLEKSKGKITFINSHFDYMNCHCFPYVYPKIKDYTPRITFVNKWTDVRSIRDVLETMNYDFFLKDYVKSIKTENGVERISKDITSKELKSKIENFIDERGSLFTGGIILKEFVDLKKIEKTNEWRVFYFNEKVLSLHQNSYLKKAIKPSVNLIKQIGELLQDKSNFFTVDFALTEDDKWIVIETGDGQVSGLPDGDELKFYNRLRKLDKWN